MIDSSPQQAIRVEQLKTLDEKKIRSLGPPSSSIGPSLPSPAVPQPPTTWPAICDFWLGKWMVPVLTVAKEVAALQRWPRSRSGRAEDRSTTNCGETFCLVICLSFVWMFFFPSRSNNRLVLLIECSKLTSIAREKRHGSWAERSMIDVGCCQAHLRGG